MNIVPPTLAASLLFLASCGAAPPAQRADECEGECSAEPSPDAGNDAEVTVARLPERCSSGTSWSPGVQAFVNKTDASGIGALGAAGVRIATADLDGDGFSDLLIRRAGNKANNYATEERSVWFLRNAGDGTFEDVTQASAIVASRYSGDSNVGRPAEVFAFADVDNDGDLDAYAGFSQDGSLFEGAEIMLNDGKGTFSFGQLGQPFHRMSEAVSVGGATFADVDRDGRVDLWVGHGAVDGEPRQDSLYTQGRDGLFVDSTTSLGLETMPWTLAALNAGQSHSNAWSTAACDLDGDGNPELLAASYGRAPNHLWHGTTSAQGVSFVNTSVASGYAWDGRDDWSDNESARCYCTLTPNAPDCAGIEAPSRIPCEQPSDAFRWTHARDRNPYRLGGNSGTTICGDVNNDGNLDLLTTEIVHWDVGSSSDPSELLLNNGDAPPTFSRPGNETTGLAREEGTSSWDHGDITGAIFDFDNDGRQDVYIGSTDYPGARGWLFHQKTDGTFEPVPLEDGIDHRRSHGIAIADYDRDGDLDVVVGHSRARCGDDCYEQDHARYWENTLGSGGNWVQLALEGGEGTNAAAIGARITVRSGELVQTQEIGGGHGHYGVQHDLNQHFGLGSACDAEVTIRWPDEGLSEQTFSIQSGYRYVVKQGADPVAIQ